jgi:hypothetical protein
VSIRGEIAIHSSFGFRHSSLPYTSVQRSRKGGNSERYAKTIRAKVKAMPIRGSNIRGCDMSRKNHPAW